MSDRLRAALDFKPEIHKMVNIIYAIELGGSIKIGKTTKLRRRMSAYRTAYPGKIRKIIAFVAPEYIEKQLHLELSQYRHDGTNEWYHAHPRVLSCISRHSHKRRICGNDEWPKWMW